MDEQELEEILRNPDEWADDGDAELRPPVKPARAVVSVAFPREDLERVSTEARRKGMKLSEYIRTAALEYIDDSQHSGKLYSLSTDAGVSADYATNRLRAPRPRVIEEEPAGNTG